MSEEPKPLRPLVQAERAAWCEAALNAVLTMGERAYGGASTAILRYEETLRLMEGEIAKLRRQLL